MVPLASLFAPEKFHFSARLFKKSGGSPRGKGLPPFSSYKDNTFSAEIQIALTLRNTPSDIHLQRFAADELWRVLYYEAHAEGRLLSAQHVSRVVNTHGFCTEPIKVGSIN